MKFSKLVAVLGVVVLSFGIGERCGAQDLHLETAVGQSAIGSLVTNYCNFGWFCMGDSVVFDTAVVIKHGVSVSGGPNSLIFFDPTYAGVFNDTFRVVSLCERRGYLQRSGGGFTTECIAHDSNSVFLSPSWDSAVSCGYQIDSQQFGGYLTASLWNLSESSLTASNWKLRLRSGPLQDISVRDSLKGAQFSTISIPAHQIRSPLLLYLTIPDSVADSAATDFATVICTIRRSGKDSTLEIPVRLEMNSVVSYGVFPNKTIDFNLAAQGRYKDSVQLEFNGLVRSIELDSLPRPLHCSLGTVGRHDAWIRVWQDGSSSGAYNCDLSVHFTNYAPFAKTHYDSTHLWITSNVLPGLHDSVWQRLNFPTGGNTFRFLLADDGTEYVYGKGLYRMNNHGQSFDVLIPSDRRVMNLSWQPPSHLTAVLHSQFLTSDPNYSNVIEHSTDGGNNWRQIMVRPFALDSGSQLPPAQFGYSPLTPLWQSDSVLFAIGDGMLAGGDFEQCPFISSDGGQHWHSIDSLRDSLNASGDRLQMWLAVDDLNTLFIGSAARSDTFGRGRLAIPSGQAFSKRFPNGKFFLYSDSSLDLWSSRSGTHTVHSSPFFVSNYRIPIQESGPAAISDSEFFSLTTEGLVYHTTDTGGTWLSYTRGLDGRATSIGVSLAGYAYAATDSALYHSKYFFPSAFANPTSRVSEHPRTAVASRGLAAYPNPATGELTIEGMVRAERVELYNVLGERMQVIFKLSDSGLQALGEVGAVQDGIYIARVLYAGGVQSVLIRIAR